MRSPSQFNTLVLSFALYLYQTFQRCLAGDIHVDCDGICDDFVNLKMMCRLSLSGVLIDRVCVHAFVVVSVSVYV